MRLLYERLFVIASEHEKLNQFFIELTIPFFAAMS